ncbi:MAG: hypothetical protein HY978_00890 [Candidatus Liptonbacteria bacterium]|nr:hypothetical protein [Candidatus Liptonbacteria bacterium]
MEGIIRGVVAALFIGLIIMGVLVFAFSFATPLKMFQRARNATSSPERVVVVERTIVERTETQVPAPQPAPPAPTPAPIPNSNAPFVNVPTPVPTPMPGPTPAPPPSTPVPMPPPAPVPPPPPPKPTYSPTAIGTSAVNPKTGEVVKMDGTPVNNTIEPGMSDAPLVSNPVTKDKYPKGAIVISITAEGMTPNTFTVHRNEAVTIVTESADQYTHVLRFKDSSLNAIAVGVGAGEARAITFNAPSEIKSEGYPYFCDVPGHASRGETGIMQVQ